MSERNIEAEIEKAKAEVKVANELARDAAIACREPQQKLAILQAEKRGVVVGMAIARMVRRVNNKEVTQRLLCDYEKWTVPLEESQ